MCGGGGRMCGIIGPEPRLCGPLGPIGGGPKCRIGGPIPGYGGGLGPIPRIGPPGPPPLPLIGGRMPFGMFIGGHGPYLGLIFIYLSLNYC